MAFIQIIDFRTDKIDEGRKHVDEWFAATEGRSTARRGLMCEDRDDPGHYINIVFFDSYESAMENSKLPQTAEISAKMGALVDGAITFTDLDVVEDRS